MATNSQVARPNIVEAAPQKITRISESSESDPEERRNLLQKQKEQLNQDMKGLKESQSIEALRRKTKEVKQKIDAVLM